MWCVESDLLGGHSNESEATYIVLRARGRGDHLTGQNDDDYSMNKRITASQAGAKSVIRIEAGSFQETTHLGLAAYGNYSLAAMWEQGSSSSVLAHVLYLSAATLWARYDCNLLSQVT